MEYFTKENPIFILNPNIFNEKLNSRNWYKFYCISCKSEVIKKGNASKELPNTYFMCRSCAKKAGTQKYLNWYNTLTADEKSIIWPKGVAPMHSVEYIHKTNPEKLKATLLAKYGVENPSQIGYVREKVKESWQLKTQEEMLTYKDECRQAQLNRGEDAIRQSYLKANKTKLDRYGTINHKQIYIYNNIPFDSSWELAFFIYYKTNNYEIQRLPRQITYYYKDQQKIYEPDFEISGQLYEIKGDHFFEGEKMINPYDRSQDGLYEAKHQCMLQNNVFILKSKEIKFYLNWIDSKFPKNFLETFRRQYAKGL